MAFTMLPQGSLADKTRWFNLNTAKLLDFIGENSKFGKFTNLLKALIEDKDIPLINVECRVKDWDSLKKKIETNRTDSDICGCRFVVRINEDVDRICRIIEANFEIDWDQTEDKRKSGAAAKDKLDSLGYEAVHYVVRLDEDTRKRAEWKKFGFFCAEVQIRTALQDAWARVSHAWDYEDFNNRSIPVEYKRKLLLASGLLENIDDMFSEINRQHIVHRKEIEIRPFAFYQKRNCSIMKDIFNDVIRKIRSFKKDPTKHLEEELNDYFTMDIFRLENIDQNDIIGYLAAAYYGFMNLVVLVFCDFLIMSLEEFVCADDFPTYLVDQANIFIDARLTLRLFDVTDSTMKCIASTHKIEGDKPSDIFMDQPNNIIAAIKKGGISRCSLNPNMHQKTAHSGHYDDYVSISFSEYGRGGNRRCNGSLSVDVKGNKVFMLDEMVKLNTFGYVRNILGWGLDRIKASFKIEKQVIVSRILESVE